MNRKLMHERHSISGKETFRNHYEGFMDIEELIRRDVSPEDTKLYALYKSYDALMTELSRKELPGEVVGFINTQVAELNAYGESDRSYRKKLRGKMWKILRLLEKTLKIVPRNYYRQTWFVLGMSVFGVPLGVVFGSAFDNMGFIGLGLPIGMVIGMSIGASLDRKAAGEGRQLDFEMPAIT